MYFILKFAPNISGVKFSERSNLLRKKLGLSLFKTLLSVGKYTPEPSM